MAVFQELMQADPNMEAAKADGVRVESGGVELARGLGDRASVDHPTPFPPKAALSRPGDRAPALGLVWSSDVYVAFVLRGNSRHSKAALLPHTQAQIQLDLGDVAFGARVVPATGEPGADASPQIAPSVGAPLPVTLFSQVSRPS